MKPSKQEMLQNIREQIVQHDGVDDEKYLIWKTIYNIVKEEKESNE